LKIVALAGGVGGAKLVDGLARVLPPDDLTIIVNTGDDFDHIGLRICPDLDTVCYSLAGLANPVTGWGRAEETWNAMQSLSELGGPDWFRLGDRDLGTHLKRTHLLQSGYRLSEITRHFCQAWGVGVRVLPMSDDPVSTWVESDEGDLPFQEYFVHQQCRPRVKGFRFDGIEKAEPTPGILKAIQESDLIIICPSNPWVSIDPILMVPGIRPALLALPASKQPVIAVSPIIEGKAIKGPAAKMYSELGFHPSALSVAHHYGSRLIGELLSGFVLDTLDQDLEQSITNLGMTSFVTDTIMMKAVDRQRLGISVLDFGKSLMS
jgi:LPPG:FO 2-phospho-L-lactate transferase